MKIFYPLLISTLLFISCLQVNAQCKVKLKTTDDGKGGYIFLAAVNDTDSVFTSYWMVDSLLVDSNTLTDTLKFYTNGNHRVCFQYSDTTGCIIDTCINLTVEDAEYHPLLDSVNIWSLQVQYLIAEPHESNNSSRSDCGYVGASDKIFTDENTTYKTLRYKSLHGDIDSCLMGYIREDTLQRKVYFADYYGNPEVLLYDFAMSTGDTIDLKYYNYFNNVFTQTTYYLDTIISLSITAGNRRAFFFHQLHAIDNITMAWLEGVGNLNHPVYLYAQRKQYVECTNNYPYYIQITNGNAVTCYSHILMAYFDSCSYNASLQNSCDGCFNIDSCTYGTVGGVGVVNIKNSNNIQLFPNPASNKLNIQIQIGQSSDYLINIWDLDGRQATVAFPLGKLSTGTYNKQIDLSALSAGFYMVECKTGEGSLYRKLVIAK